MIRPFGNGTYEVQVIHPGGETKWLPIEAVYQTFIAVRWGLSGTYDIYVDKNVMIARSIKARRKGRCYWKAVDIESVKKFIYEHFHPKEKENLQKSFDEHVKNMPGRVKPISSSGK